jgi:hypothetical protein
MHPYQCTPPRPANASWHDTLRSVRCEQNDAQIAAADAFEGGSDDGGADDSDEEEIPEDLAGLSPEGEVPQLTPATTGYQIQYQPCCPERILRGLPNLCRAVVWATRVGV